jgi:hypothetical protein
MGLVDALGSTVLFLYKELGGSPIGTAFTIGYPVPDAENTFIPLIVTAKHVVGDLPTVVARFSMKNGRTPGHVGYDLRQAQLDGDLWEHPDDGVDIVVFRTPHLVGTDYQVIPTGLVATLDIFKSEEIGITDRVVIPSLLWNFMGASRNYPVFRRGDIALIPDEKVPLKYSVGAKEITTEQSVIFVDALAIQGASGSPVFLWPGPRLKSGAFTVGGGRPYLIGIVHGFYPSLPREVLEIQTAASRPYFAENSGIAIVFPAYRILEIFDLDPFKERMTSLLKSSGQMSS